MSHKNSAVCVSTCVSICVCVNNARENRKKRGKKDYSAGIQSDSKRLIRYLSEWDDPTKEWRVNLAI